MTMPSASSVASLIVSALAVPGPGVAQATVAWTAIISQIQTMLVAATVAVPATGIVAPNGACTGAAVGTIS